MNEKESKQIVIIGGVAGGASAAARLRRLSETARITMFERGEDISFANCGMPYYIGGEIEKRKSLLVQTPEGFRERYEVDVRVQSEVTRIDRKAKTVTVHNLQTGENYDQSYDALILSPGAAPVMPPLPGVDLPGVHSLRNMTDMDAIRKDIDTSGARRAVVVGGGFIGLEMVEAFRERGLEVMLVELLDQVFAPADPEMAVGLINELECNGVNVRLGVSLQGIHQENDSLVAELSTGEKVETDIVLMAVGVRPETGLAKDAGLLIGTTGGIATDKQMRTSDPNIFAVGDAVEITEFAGQTKALIPLAGPANRQARIAADAIFGRESTYADSQGTSVCKLFNMTAATTGLNEKVLQREGIEYEKIYVHSLSHAGYYPGAKPMCVKLLFTPADGKILGAQIIGADGVDKRIDVLAVAQRAGLAVQALTELELAYAPPYGSAKDPVNYAGFVATNVINGDVTLAHAADMNTASLDQMLLDVRTAAEVEMGTIPGATNIPLDDLRTRLDELPRDRELMVFCKAGLRGYLACRILEQNGFRCRNLTGGYTTYKAYMNANLDRSSGTPVSPGKTPAAPSPCEQLRHCGGEAPENSCGNGAPAADQPAEIVEEIDARALQCPGPIMQVKTQLEAIQPGQAIAITTMDSGFLPDIEGWCISTGNRLVDTSASGGEYRAVIARATETTPAPLGVSGPDPSKKKTIVVFSGDFDKAMASMIIANGAAAMGSEVTMFFTFWGLNVLRRPESVPVKKNLIEKMFGWMMPRGAEKLPLSSMNMMGMGQKMIKGIMKKHNVNPLPELIRQAQEAGVQMVACTMSMNLMGLHIEEMIDGVEEGGVAMYLNNAEQGRVNLFI